MELGARERARARATLEGHTNWVMAGAVAPDGQHEISASVPWCPRVGAATYQQGRVAISLEGLRDSDRPQLKVRAGVDANQLVLAADPP